MKNNKHWKEKFTKFERLWEKIQNTITEHRHMASYIKLLCTTIQHTYTKSKRKQVTFKCDFDYVICIYFSFTLHHDCSRARKKQPKKILFSSSTHFISSSSQAQLILSHSCVFPFRQNFRSYEKCIFSER